MHSICIPAAPPVQIGPWVELLDTPAFQRLRGRKQLGVNDLVFPGAVHTRFEHTIGVLAHTQKVCQIQHFSEHDAVKLQLFALLHDIGHGPFSHQIESILPGNHHLHGMKLLREALASQIEKTGVAIEEIEALFLGTDSLGKWVSDRNLGTDKLDYLRRDALHIGFYGTPDIERIQYATRITQDGDLAIEEKFVEDAKMLQKFYSYLHQHGYLNKTALTIQRMLQRLMQEVGGEEEDWNLVDRTFMEQLKIRSERQTNPLAKELLANLVNRQLHKSFLVLKPTGYSYVERQANKPIAVQEMGRIELRALCEKLSAPDMLKEMEDLCAEKMGLPHGSILFAAMPYFKKLLPKDLRVLSAGGHDSYWLFEKDVDHRKSLESDYLRTFAIRLTCPEKYRRQLYQKTDTLLSFLQA